MSRNNSAAVMDAVEAGETFHVTRNGVEVAEVRPLHRRRAITLAELHQGVAMARDAAVRAARTETLGAAIAEFDPLPFDGRAAARFGTLVALVLEAHRDPKPRRPDLMIAAIASSRDLPLYTRNAKDFAGLGDMVEVVEV